MYTVTCFEWSPAIYGHFHCQVFYFMFILWQTCLIWYLATSQANFMVISAKLSQVGPTIFRKEKAYLYGKGISNQCTGLRLDRHFIWEELRLEGRLYWVSGKVWWSHKQFLWPQTQNRIKCMCKKCCYFVSCSIWNIQICLLVTADWIWVTKPTKPKPISELSCLLCLMSIAKSYS